MTTDCPRPDLADEVWYDADAGPVVRLFALTRGRVAGDNTTGLDLDTVVTTGPAAAGLARLTELADLADLSPEQAEILRLCVRPVSVAEVAAHLGLPVSSVRVLLTDLRADGRLVAGTERSGDEPSDQLLGKVLTGLWDL